MKDGLYRVYMLRCADGTYYVGVTNDLDRRLLEHSTGESPKSYTYRRRPITLVYHQEFFSIWMAIGWEKELKTWSRKKKEALIENRLDDLPDHLAKKRFY